jgi:hypothetical protein
MIVKHTNLADLYEADETAWLDAMAELIARGEFSQLDYEHLREYVTDMANRDRKEVRSRLIVLIAHILKWEHQRSRRSKSWGRTIREQQRELEPDVSRGVLRRHALEVLAEAYQKALGDASYDMGVPEKRFPTECPYTLDQLLEFDVSENGE